MFHNLIRPDYDRAVIGLRSKRLCIRQRCGDRLKIKALFLAGLLNRIFIHIRFNDIKRKPNIIEDFRADCAAGRQNDFHTDEFSS